MRCYNVIQRYEEKTRVGDKIPPDSDTDGHEQALLFGCLFLEFFLFEKIHKGGPGTLIKARTNEFNRNLHGKVENREKKIWLD